MLRRDQLREPSASISNSELTAPAYDAGRESFVSVYISQACAVASAISGLLVLSECISKRPSTLNLRWVILVSALWGVIAWGVFRLAVWIAQDARTSSEE